MERVDGLHGVAALHDEEAVARRHVPRRYCNIKRKTHGATATEPAVREWVQSEKPSRTVPADCFVGYGAVRAVRSG